MPQNKDWFAYKTSEEAPQAFLAEAVGRELGLPFEPPDIALTAGAFAAISVAFRLVLDAGDEAIFSEPAWFCYEPMLLAADAVPRKVPLKQPRFDLDLDAIDAAIGPRTRLVIVNTPHNPTGRIYGREVAGCARRPARARLDADRPPHLPAVGRALSAPALRRARLRQPGGRLPLDAHLVQLRQGPARAGPAAGLSRDLAADAGRRPAGAARRDVRGADVAGLVLSRTRVMQYAVPDLDRLSIDVQALARRRDGLSEVLTRAGHAVLPPEGTFYLWVRWPSGDPERQWNALADRGVFVMPGSIMNAPDYFRISLTASDEMVARALPAFAQVS